MAHFFKNWTIYDEFRFGGSWPKQKPKRLSLMTFNCHYIFPTHTDIILIDMYKCIISQCENLYPFQIKKKKKKLINKTHLIFSLGLGPVGP